MTVPSEEEEVEAIDAPPPSEGKPRSTATVLAVAIFVAALTALAIQLAFSPNRVTPRAPSYFLGGLYAAIGVVAVLRLRQRGELHLIKPRSGDITFGALPAFLLFGLTFAFHALVTSPTTPRHGWIMRVYLLLGDPFADGRHLVAVGAAVVGLLEELTWRGFVTPLLEEQLGIVRANAASTLLYAAAHLPAMWALADPTAGLNPLLPVAALGCGAAWSYLRWRMERLPPVLISHALYTWMVVEFPLWR